MRVLHSESSTGWGGQENRTLQEAIQLRKHGVDVSFAVRKGARLGLRARQHGFAVDEMPMRNGFDPSSIFALARIFRRNHIDVVNTHSSRDTLLCGIAARLGRHRPLVVRTRHLILPITSKATYSLLPDHVVCVSGAVCDYLEAAGVPKSMLTTIATGVDTKRFDPDTPQPDLREELGLRSDAFVIGTIAILRIKKGYQDLIAAIPRVLTSFPEAHFIFVGDGPQRGNIEHALTASNLDRHVHLLGLRSDVPRILKGIDLFVLPTHEEALGTAYLEAQAMGVPIIGTRVGGVPATMIEGKTGLLVPVREPAALATAVIQLAGDHERRQAMGEAGRHWIRSEYSVETMGERMLGLYRRLLQERCG